MQTSSLVLEFMAPRKAWRVASLSPGVTAAAVKLMPRSFKAARGRMTALCSMSLTTTWSPGCRQPFITRFRAWVQLG